MHRRIYNKLKLPGIVVAFSTVFGMITFVLCVVGMVWYQAENAAEQNYKESNCLVLNQKLEINTCSRHTCHGSTDTKSCSSEDYDCYEPVWLVMYALINGTYENSSLLWGSTFDGNDTALITLGEYQIGSTYTCYYDSRSVVQVRWAFPNAGPYLAMFIICFLLTILFVAIIVLSVVLKLRGYRTPLDNYFDNYFQMNDKDQNTTTETYDENQMTDVVI